MAGNIAQLPRYAVPVSVMHTVTPGQTLGHIANIHGVSQDAILAHPMNRHTTSNGARVYPGMRIAIPMGSQQVT